MFSVNFTLLFSIICPTFPFPSPFLITITIFTIILNGIIQPETQRILSLKSPQLCFLLRDLVGKLERLLGPAKLNPFAGGESIIS